MVDRNKSTEPELIGVGYNREATFHVYRYSDGSVQIRKPEDNEVARQHGIHTINLTDAERKAMAKILARGSREARGRDG
jgi:hypothetical protein